MAIRVTLLALSCALIAGCRGWEGPPQWFQERYEAGLPASACAPGPTPSAPPALPIDLDLNTRFAGWTLRVRAQAARCIVHTDPLGASRAAWVECRVEGPALLERASPAGSSGVFSAGARPFELRATRRGLSCRPLPRT